MSDTTVTITSATNPTYGGYVSLDTVHTAYTRTTLDLNPPQVGFNGVDFIDRIFAFFDLSTDPTSGGDITKVELLATVNSVSGTHAVDVYSVPTADDNALFIASGDQSIYEAGPGLGITTVTGQTLSSGALVLDLGAQALADVIATITAGQFYFLETQLSNEAAAGSVVFDAAVGFGLRITYTTAAAPANLKTFNGIAAASCKTINGVPIANVKTVNSI